MSGGKQKKGGEKKNGAGKNKEPETAGWHQDYREAGNRNMQSLGYDLIVDDDGIIQEAGKIVEKTEDFEQKLGSCQIFYQMCWMMQLCRETQRKISCCLQMKCRGYGQKHRR